MAGIEPPDTEEITVCAPKHPIAQGVSDFVLPKEEMYGNPFEVPPPLCLVFQSYFPLGGEYFPAGACWTVGNGKTPASPPAPARASARAKARVGSSTSAPATRPIPTYFDPNVQRILHNAVLWCSRRS